MIGLKHSDIEAFQSEMEDNFMIECSPEDIKLFPEARKLYKYLLKSRKRVNAITKLKKKVLLND